MSKLFTDLLKGTQFESSEVEKILKESKSDFRLNAFYVVCVLTLNEEQDISGLPPSVIGELCELISDYCGKHDSIYHMTAMDHNRLAVVFAFNKDDSVIKLLKGLTDLEPVIRTFSKKHSLTFRLNAGHMYTSILDIGFSYREALSALEEDTKSAAKNDSVQAPAEENPGRIPARVTQILDLVQKDDLGSAVKLSNRTIDELSKSGENVLENYKLYMNLIQNGISKIDYINFSAFSNDLLLPQINGPEDADEEALIVSMKDSCETILQQLSRILKRKNNPYIISSQNYIHEHYQDYDLSQNTVAEAIGVKSTYLSKLFKESLGVNFTDYLNQYRIQKSLALLTETNEPLNEVALHSGYNSVQNYIRVFKKYMNMTPGQYRKEEGGKSLFS
nr:helix-turn-helix domain-containing protein [Clostridium sp. MCC353]